MKKDMEKTIVCALLLCASAAFGLDWKLPVFTLKYDVAGGTAEDPEDDLLLPSSLRNTASLAVKQSADPLAFGLAVRYSTKDYLLQIGDYTYIAVDQETTFDVSDFLGLGLTFGGKWSTSPEPDSDGLSKDFSVFRTKGDADIKLVPGTSLALSMGAEYDFYAAEAKSRQIYTAGAGVSSRLGEWLLSGKYRGVFRLPLGGASGIAQSFMNEGSFTLQWDPNR